MTALTSRYEVGESSIAAPRPAGGHGIDYGFIGTLDAETRHQRAKEEQDTQDIYAVIEDTQDRQTRIFQSVEALIDNRQYHYETARLLDQEALVSREDWAHSMGLSSAVHYELQGYRTHAWMQDHLSTANNTPPKRSSATARAVDAAARAAAAAAPMTAAVEQLIEARVSATLVNHETLRNSTNGHGDGSHNSGI
ncbi:hypothetical protein Tco_1520515 [Tanacetum coccineum]